MTEEAKEARRQYRKMWYERNRDKAKEYTVRYWEKKAAQEMKSNEARTSRREPLING